MVSKPPKSAQPTDQHSAARRAAGCKGGGTHRGATDDAATAPNSCAEIRLPPTAAHQPQT
eukprot:15414554-Alexandrium_andersonii.AAC.1